MVLFEKKLNAHKETDCGKEGKVMESIINWGKAGSGRPATQGQIDAFIKGLACEIKTRGGELAILQPYEYDGYQSDRQGAIVAKAMARQLKAISFVIYCPQLDITKDRNEILADCYVISKDNWINLIVNGGTYTTPTGRQGKAKLHKRNVATRGGFRLNLQVNGIDFHQVMTNAGAISLVEWKSQK